MLGFFAGLIIGIVFIFFVIPILLVLFITAPQVFIIVSIFVFIVWMMISDGSHNAS